MRKLRLCVLLVFLAAPLALAGCDDNGSVEVSSFTSPSLASSTGSFGNPAPFVGAKLVPDVIPFIWVPGFGCPFAAPFTATLAVLIDQRRGGDVFLSQVGFDFMDTVGLVSPVLYSQTDLSAMFGTVLVPGGTSRRFDFTPRFGCGFSRPPSRVGVRLGYRDRSGGRHEKTITARLE